MIIRAKNLISLPTRQYFLSLVPVLLFFIFIFWGPAVLAATVTWNVDADGDWNEGSNWSTGLPPIPGDEVVIDRAAGTYTITVSTGDQYANAVICAENLTISGGTLTVVSTIQVGGELVLSGGTLVDATILSPVSCSGNLGALDGVTLNANLVLGEVFNTTVYIYNGLTLNGTAYLGQNNYPGQLVFSNTQTLSGNGEVVFGDRTDNKLIGFGVLTIGPEILIHGNHGWIRSSFGLVNRGTIRCAVSGGLLTLDAMDWRNEGVIEATADGKLVLEGWVKTADLGDFRAVGGVIELDGILDNTGDVLTLDGTTGSLTLDMGTIISGTIGPFLADSKIIYRGISGILDGVIMDADMFVVAKVTILNGLTLNGTGYIGWEDLGGSLEFEGTQILAGTGEVVFGYPGAGTLRCDPGFLTIGPEMHIHGAKGMVIATDGFVNQGLISCDVDIGGVITLTAFGWRNEGTIEAINGGTLRLGGRITTADLGDLRGAGGQVILGGLLDNTDDDLELDGVTGSMILYRGGTIFGGRVAPGAGGARIIYRSGGVLDGVVMDADMLISESGTEGVTIQNGLTLNGTAYLGQEDFWGSIFLSGIQTIGGTGGIIFGNRSGNNITGEAGTVTIGPDLLIYGKNGRFEGTSDFVNLGAISQNIPSGTISFRESNWSNQGTIESQGGVLDFQSPLTNAGVLHVYENGRLDTDGTLTQTMGLTQVDSSGIIYSHQSIDIQGGKLSGCGLTGGFLVNAGLIAPGASAGILSHYGDFSQAAAGTLSLELGGVEQGMYDQFVITGAANLDGVLSVEWIDNFSPAIGDTFRVMEFGSINGTFAKKNLPALPPGLSWVVDYRLDSVVLNLVGPQIQPIIQEIADIPDDEGGFLEISWNASTQDDPGESNPVTFYEVRRFSGAWQLVGTVPAVGHLNYSATVPTPDIFTQGEPEPWGQYRVLGRTETTGIFYSSPADSGYSIDNLPPPPPVLVLTEDLDSRLLSWLNPGVDDLDVTCLFRTDELDFLPDTLLFCTEESSWVETHQFYYNYYAQAIDIHGNAGDFSPEVEYVYPSQVADSMPMAPVLAANVPNPFNPGTLIRFELPRTMNAQLAIYSLDGKRIVTLVNGNMDAGPHEYYWRGKDRRDRRVAAGVYFYRLEAGNFKQTRPMTLLK